MNGQQKITEPSTDVIKSQSTQDPCKTDGASNPKIAVSVPPAAARTATSATTTPTAPALEPKAPGNDGISPLPAEVSGTQLPGNATTPPSSPKDRLTAAVGTDATGFRTMTFSQAKAAVLGDSNFTIDPDFASLPDSVQPPTVIIEEEDYYHGFMPRQDANSLLKLDGDFLFRTTEVIRGHNRKMCLSVYQNNGPHHIIVNENTKTHQYSIDEKQPFPSIADLVAYYSKHHFALGSIKMLLKIPVLTQVWELRHSQIKLLKRLGSGAYGEVHYGRLALTPRFFIDVAIKQLKCAQMDKEKVREMMNEVRMMRDLRHPNVVRFFGVANKQEPLMIVMELVKCGALDQYLIKRGDSISLKTRMIMICDAAQGLEYVHGQGILHRDIAARNCLFNGEQLKLGDFGMSEKTVEHRMTAVEKAPLRWLAPEVFRTHLYNVQSDVWAFGILIWEIFNNALEPYKGWNGKQVKAAVLSGYRLTLPEWVPNKMKTMYEKTLDDDPHERPSMAKLAKELRIENGRPLHTRVSIYRRQVSSGLRNVSRPRRIHSFSSSSKISREDRRQSLSSRSRQSRSGQIKENAVLRKSTSSSSRQ